MLLKAADSHKSEKSHAEQVSNKSDRFKLKKGREINLVRW